MSTIKHIAELSQQPLSNYGTGTPNGTAVLNNLGPTEYRYPLDIGKSGISKDGNVLATHYTDNTATNNVVDLFITFTEDNWATKHDVILPGSWTYGYINSRASRVAMNNDGSIIYTISFSLVPNIDITCLGFEIAGICIGTKVETYGDSVANYQAQLNVFQKSGSGSSATWNKTFTTNLAGHGSPVPSNLRPERLTGFTSLEGSTTDGITVTFSADEVGAIDLESSGIISTSYDINYSGGVASSVTHQGFSFFYPNYTSTGLFTARDNNVVIADVSNMATIMISNYSNSTIYSFGKDEGANMDLADISSPFADYGVYTQYDHPTTSDSVTWFSLNSIMRRKATNTDYIYGLRMSSDTNKSALNMTRLDTSTNNVLEWEMEYDVTDYIGFLGDMETSEVTFTTVPLSIQYIRLHVFDDDKKILMEVSSDVGGWFLITSTDTNPINSGNYTIQKVRPETTSHGIPDILYVSNSGLAIMEERMFPSSHDFKETSFLDGSSDPFKCISSLDGFRDSYDYDTYELSKSINHAPRLITTQF